MAASASRAKSGSVSRPTGRVAWRVTALSTWPTESCSSRASRATGHRVARCSAAREPLGGWPVPKQRRPRAHLAGQPRTPAAADQVQLLDQLLAVGDGVLGEPASVSGSSLRTCSSEYVASSALPSEVEWAGSRRPTRVKGRR
ncbi:hypothetical protein SANTM175S_07779 [Streptomyces antimycoticus]